MIEFGWINKCGLWLENVIMIALGFRGKWNSWEYYMKLKLIDFIFMIMQYVRFECMVFGYWLSIWRVEICSVGRLFWILLNEDYW
jgi:hypothetical protein